MDVVHFMLYAAFVGCFAKFKLSTSAHKTICVVGKFMYLFRV